MLKLLLTCEHAGNQVPAAYAEYFKGHEELLASHKGYDIGALELFNNLKPLATKCFYEETTRLLIEQNRSLHHSKLFSGITRELDDAEKAHIIKAHYLPYRDQIEQFIHDFVMAGRQVVHVAIHSFTPKFNEEVRDADIGLLYDPKRKPEQAFCRIWKQELQRYDEDLLIRYNYPYLGISDGLTTYLRRKFKANEYIGIELEVNQKFPLTDKAKWNQLQEFIKDSLEVTITQQQPEDVNL